MRLNIKECCEAIKRSVGIETILHEYGVRESRIRGRYFCPFHNDGKNPGASIAKGYFHCFVCNKGWDIIAFVKEFEKCSTWDAIKLIDSNFHLGLTSPLTREQKIEVEKRRLASERMEQRRIAQKNFETDCMRRLLRRIRYWESKKDKFSITADDCKRGYWYNSPKFFTALKNLDWLDWLFCIIGGFYHPECEYDYTYGTDKRKILILLYKKQIFIK